MFTGIVQGTARLERLVDEGARRSLTLALPEGLGAGLQRGASVSVSGVCLTAVDIDGDAVRFDVIDETLARSTLGAVREGDRLNVERAATFGAEIGGHLISGHIWGTAEVVEVHTTPKNRRITLRPPPDALPYLLPKGYVGLDGASLTLGRVSEGTFDVHLIPETLEVTTLADLAPGDRVNLEIDALTQAVVATVERVLAARGEDTPPGAGVGPR
jgi:riboflavin synthase